MRAGTVDLGESETPVSNPTLSISPRRKGIFSLSYQHSALSATVLLSLSSVLSGVLALVRTKYIAYVFGAGSTTDAYNAAFILPDMISYFLIGGVASISLVTILSRFREKGDEAGGDRALSAVLVAMSVVLTTAVLLAEVFAPLYTRHAFRNLDGPTQILCTHLTRILLPGQILFFVGGVLGSRLLVRKIFLFQAMTPLIYNLGIILGGVMLSRRIGIDSLAVGALSGALLGSALLNAAGAFGSGLKFTPVFNLRHPAFVEWLRLSLPLMLGVSLAMADRWILAHYAAADRGGITRLGNAKALFNAPLSVIGMAAGAASLPFFSSLFAQSRLFDFNAAVSRAISRLIAVSLLISAWLIALAGPVTDLLLRGGLYTHTAARSTADYLIIFAVSLALWSAQGIYARAFYAARNTLTPAISGTVVTALSIPIYALLFHHFGVEGLAVASNLGILAHTAALAILLHRARLVSLATLDYGEIGRSALAGFLAGFAAWQVAERFTHPTGHGGDFVQIAVGTVVWAGVSAGVLWGTGSTLPVRVFEPIARRFGGSGSSSWQRMR